MRSLLLILVICATVLAFSSTLLATSFFTPPEPTGYASATQDASVNLSILSAIIISVEDNVINFGTCVPNSSRGYSLVDSAVNATQAHNSDCTDGTYPDYFTVRNSGSSGANITVQSNLTGQEFFNDSDSWIAYRAIPVSASCAAGFQSTYRNFSVANTQLRLCDALLNNENINMTIQAYINESVENGGSVSLTFTGSIA